jgi:folate-binding Fe-S cluster repair protein YgfZ
MQHRGTARKRVLVLERDTDLPPPGTDVTTMGGPALGEITSVYGTRGFALVRLDRLAEAAGRVEAGGMPVRLVRQSWLDGGA